MKRNPLDQTEDKAFSQRVLNYNRTTDKEAKEEQKEEIEEKTKVLIYMVSLQNLFLSSDEASKVFEECLKELGAIIASYRISTATFNTYLTQVCRFRARRIRHKAAENAILEYNYAGDSEPFYYLEEDPAETLELREVPDSRHRGEYNSLSLGETFHYIVRNRNRTDYPTFSRVERVLRKELMSRTRRKELLSYILTLPDSGTEVDVINYARVFCTDEEAFHHLEKLKRDHVREKTTHWETAMDLAAKHWRMMCMLKTSMFNAENKSRYAEFQARYRRHAKCHRDRLKDAQNALRGMTQTELGELLGVSRSAISLSIKKTRALLLDLTGQSPI